MAPSTLATGTVRAHLFLNSVFLNSAFFQFKFWILVEPATLVCKKPCGGAVGLDEQSLTILAAVLFIGLLVPSLFERFRVPFVSSLVLVGAVLGPHGADLVRPDETLTLFAFLGAAFQMLLAGFEAGELDLRPDRENAIVFVTNGILPAVVGALLGLYFGYSWRGSLLTAAVFLSSSILLVYSFSRHFSLDAEQLGHRLRSAAVLQDFAGTLVAFVILKSVSPHPRFSLPILLGLVFSSVVALRMFFPEVAGFAFARFRQAGEAAIEQRVRFVLASMLAVLVLFSTLDVPPIVAAFLVGFSLTAAEQAEALRERLHLIGYTLFIPVFLFTVGLETDVWALLEFPRQNWVVVAIVVAAIASKVGGGYWGGMLIGLSKRGATALGLASSVKLAVPITVTYAALQEGIIGPDLFTAVVIISLLTTLIMPIALEVVLKTKAKK